MSEKHPIIAVTGACGAGTTSVQHAFKEIFYRQSINPAYVEGDGFLRYSNRETEQRVAQALENCECISCYGPDLNDFARLETCFRNYSEQGTGESRFRISAANRHLYEDTSTGFTPWQALPPDTDCLFYEGMHGGVVAETWARRKSKNTIEMMNDRRKGRSKGVNVAQYVDLLIGVVPAINLEWIQRIHSDQRKHLHTPEEVTQNILDQLQDYIDFIVPQFSIADINFQRMPVVDTSNPFEIQPVPTEKESVIVVSFREADKHDLVSYVNRIDDAFLSRRTSLVIPGGQLQHALDIICAPLIEELVSRN